MEKQDNTFKELHYVLITENKASRVKLLNKHTVKHNAATVLLSHQSQSKQNLPGI